MIKIKISHSPILYAIKNDSIDIVLFLIHYAEENNILLEFNVWGNDEAHPIYNAFVNAYQDEKTDIIELLVSYIKINEIEVNYNKFDFGKYIIYYDDCDNELKDFYNKNNLKHVEIHDLFEEFKNYQDNLRRNKEWL